MNKFIIILVLCLLSRIPSYSLMANPDTVWVKTSVVCGMCKDRIEQDLAFEKGIRDVDVDLKTKIVMVVYRKDKTTPETIRKRITALGYDADDLPADPVAYSKLSACCKKDAPPH